MAQNLLIALGNGALDDDAFRQGEGRLRHDRFLFDAVPVAVLVIVMERKPASRNPEKSEITFAKLEKIEIGCGYRRVRLPSASKAGRLGIFQQNGTEIDRCTEIRAIDFMTS